MILLFVYAACFIIALSIPTFFASQIKTVKDFFALRRLKPVDCSACLSFWFTLFCFVWETNIFYAILISLSSFFLQGHYFIYKMNRP